MKIISVMHQREATFQREIQQLRGLLADQDRTIAQFSLTQHGEEGPALEERPHDFSLQQISPVRADSYHTEKALMQRNEAAGFLEQQELMMSQQQVDGSQPQQSYVLSTNDPQIDYTTHELQERYLFV